MSVMEDRISDLPDSMICHILYYLPTEEAVATSILSKRWRHIWLAVPHLRFNDKRYSQNKDTYSRFIHMVYTAMLLLGREQQSIKKMRLLCESSLCDPCVVNTWLMATNQRKVEHIYLSLPSELSLSFSVFSSTTLVVLSLRNFNVNNNCSSLSFPSLKILRLRRLHFLGLGYLVQILSACPILRSLLMKSLTFTNSLTDGPPLKQFELPKLVKARISKSSASLPLKPFYDVRYLHAEVLIREELPTHNLVKLTYMELSFMGHYWDWLIKLLCYCPNLHTLVVDKMQEFSLTKSSDDKNWEPPQSVPKCLLSQLKIFIVKKYEGIESEFQFIKYILHNARVLLDVTVCCTGSSNPQDKLQTLQNLSLCQWGSILCQHYE